MPVKFYPLLHGNWGYALCESHAGNLTISQDTELPCDQCELDKKEKERTGSFTTAMIALADNLKISLFL
jgi:hypothetical protein